MSLPFLELFEPLRLLGEGGMGAVWEVRHRASDAVLAVKFGRERDATSARDRLAFEREVRAQARVHHPGVLPVLAFGELATAIDHGELHMPAGRRWCAFESLPGGSLADVELDGPTLRVVLLKLLDALAHCHARDLVHLDLKPENLLFRERATDVVLADFGLAQLMGAQDRLIGTPAYMPPEQWRRQPLDGRADLYALGCVAYRLFVGIQPFLGPPRALMEAHLERDLPPTDEPELDGWIARMTAKDPAARFQTAAAAAAAFPRTLGTAGVRPTSAPPLSLTALVDVTPAEGGSSDVNATLRPLPQDWRTPRGRLHRSGTLGLGALGVREVPVLGREAVQDALWAAAHRVASGHGSACVVLSGPPGVGRSRMLRWFRARLRELDAAVLLERPHAYGPDLPFAVHLVDDADADQLVALERAVAGWNAVEAPVLAVATTHLAERATLRMAPLPGSEALALTMAWAALSPVAAAQVVEAGGGLPGAMAWVLECAMREATLTQTSDGLVLSAPPPSFDAELTDAERDLVATVQALPIPVGHRIVELQPTAPLQTLRGLLRRGLVHEEGELLRTSARCPSVELRSALRRRVSEMAPTAHERALHRSFLDVHIETLLPTLEDSALRMAGPVRDRILRRAQELVEGPDDTAWTPFQVQRAYQARDTGDEAQAEEAITHLRHQSDAHALGLALCAMVELLARGPRVAEAWPLILEAQRLLSDTGTPRERILAQTAAAQVAMNLFDWAAADRALAEAETIEASAEDRVRIVPWRRALLASTGHVEEALRLSLEELERHPTFHGLRNGLPLLWWELRRPREAIAFAGTGTGVPPVIRQIVETLTAMSHLAIGDWEAADRATLRPAPGYSESTRRHVRLVCAAAHEDRPFELLVTALRPPDRPRFDDMWETWLLRTAAWRAERAGLYGRASLATRLANERAARLPEDVQARIPPGGPFP